MQQQLVIAKDFAESSASQAEIKGEATVVNLEA
jgi:hypothetical protein